MKLRRLVLLLAVLSAGTLWASTSRGATTATPTGLPLYQFVDTGTGPLPWNAVSLQSTLHATTMVGGPHSAEGPNGGVIAYRTNTGALADLVIHDDNTTQWNNLTANNDVPVPGADPVPFFDPYGNVDLLYVDQASHVILLSPNETLGPWWRQLHGGAPWRPLVTTDLTALTGVPAANGLPSVQVAVTTGTIAYRTSTNALEVV
ncbi:MAG TPA: hypothetical protein PLG60_03360, partial [Acidimicrobiales bacterium]|nr:hypothetical protein [Acidimicrobiales bacterium]